jgi:hypothetical protein
LKDAAEDLLDILFPNGASTSDAVRIAVAPFAALPDCKQFETVPDGKVCAVKCFGGTSGTSGGAADPMAINYACHTRNFESFLAAVRAGHRPELDGLEGRKAVAIIEACYRSARTGRAAHVS